MQFKSINIYMSFCYAELPVAGTVGELCDGGYAGTSLCAPRSDSPPCAPPVFALPLPQPPLARANARALA